MRIAIFVISVFVLIACSSSPVPNGIIPPHKMKEIVFDLIQADEFINSFAVKDTTVNIKTRRITLYEQVFAIHRTSKDDFYKSYRYYQQHPDKNKVLFDSLYAVANRKKIEAV
jgi:hypothetical protein